MMMSLLSLVLLADLEVLHREQQLLVHSQSNLDFELDLSNTAHAVRQAYLPNLYAVTAPLPFNIACLQGYCFFGEYRHTERSLIDCRYRSPLVSIAEDDSLWQDPNTHRVYRNGDHHYRIISEFLCFSSLGEQLPIYRTLIRAERRSLDTIHARRQLQLVHTASQIYDWQEHDMLQYSAF